MHPAGRHFQRAGGALVHRHIQIHLIRCARHRLRIYLHVVKIAQQLHPFARALDFGHIVGGTFHLTQFATHHFITGFVVAADVDAVHVHFAIRHHHQGKIHHAGFGVGLRAHINLAESITCRTHTILHGFEAVHHFRAVVPAAFFHGEQFFQLGLGHFAGIAFNRHFAPAVTLAFVHIHLDGLCFFVFAHRHIHVGDAEIKITIILVKIVDAFQILAEFGVGKAVAFGNPSKQTPFAQRHLVTQLAIGIALIAIKFDVGNGGGGAFVDFHVHRHAVALQPGDFRSDAHRIFAAVAVFLLQTSNSLIECGLVKRARLPQAEGIQIFTDGVVGKGFAAGHAQAADYRTLHHGEQNLVAQGFHAHIVKKTGGIKVFNDFLTLRIGKSIAHFYRQVIEHGGRLGALQAFHTDVLNGKRSRCQGHTGMAQCH